MVQLKLEWERYKGLDFKYYRIYKRMTYSQSNKNLVATITSRDLTSYTDTTYHGERSGIFIL